MKTQIKAEIIWKMELSSTICIWAMKVIGYKVIIDSSIPPIWHGKRFCIKIAIRYKIFLTLYSNIEAKVGMTIQSLQLPSILTGETGGIWMDEEKTWQPEKC